MIMTQNRILNLACEALEKRIANAEEELELAEAEAKGIAIVNKQMAKEYEQIIVNKLKEDIHEYTTELIVLYEMLYK